MVWRCLACNKSFPVTTPVAWTCEITYSVVEDQTRHQIGVHRIGVCRECLDTWPVEEPERRAKTFTLFDEFMAGARAKAREMEKY